VRGRALGLAAGAVLLLAAAAAFGLYHLSRARCFAIGAPAVCRVETTKPLVALTFDDGPTELGLASILPLLEAHAAHATFFLIGAEMETRPDLAPRVLAAGHELGNHSFHHDRMMLQPAGRYDREIETTEALLRRAGAAPGLFRPPFGKKLLGLPLALKRHGLTMILWDVEDPQTRDPAAFAAQVVREARPGSIILLHAMYPANATARAALPAILAGLQAKGLRAVSVGTLLAEAGGVK
jgi:peptidoglycan/xylan/chitin deacetylase (PgdA/CDA1 family)